MVMVLLRLGFFVVVAGIIVLVIMRWFRKEPIQLQKEKLQEAVDWRNLSAEMAKKVRQAIELNPSMTPAELTGFIEQWGAGDIGDIAQATAATEQEHPANKEGDDESKPVVDESAE